MMNLQQFNPAEHKNLTDFFHTALLKDFNKSNHAKRSHHPSGVERCLREQYYKWKNEPVTNPTPASGAVKMSFGKMYEDKVAEYLEKHFYRQKEITIELDGLKNIIHGYLDFYNEILVIELKRMAGAYTVKVIKSRVPSQSHLYQLLFYLKKTGVENGKLFLVGDNEYCNYADKCRKDSK